MPSLINLRESKGRDRGGGLKNEKGRGDAGLGVGGLVQHSASADDPTSSHWLVDIGLWMRLGEEAEGGGGGGGGGQVSSVGASAEDQGSGCRTFFFSNTSSVNSENLRFIFAGRFFAFLGLPLHTPHVFLQLALTIAPNFGSLHLSAAAPQLGAAPPVAAFTPASLSSHACQYRSTFATGRPHQPRPSMHEACIRVRHVCTSPQSQSSIEHNGQHYSQRVSRESGV